MAASLSWINVRGFARLWPAVDNTLLNADQDFRSTLPINDDVEPAAFEGGTSAQIC
ncbi:MAG: hypothetical protein O2983_08370 [Planctomycetota bacterium]|nr:hypothetical protein [Planctomycetota bacterium]